MCVGIFFNQMKKNGSKNTISDILNVTDEQRDERISSKFQLKVMPEASEKCKVARKL